MQEISKPYRNTQAAAGSHWRLPFLPLDSSDNHQWEGFGLRHYRVPAFEVPEQPLTAHRIQIQLGRPVRLEALENGRLLRRRFINGDLIYTPPKVRYGARWEQEREILVIQLEPSFVTRAAQGVFSKDQICTAPRFRFRDTIVEATGRALFAELGSANSLGRLYAESLANVLAIHLLRRYSASDQPIREANSGLSKRNLCRAIEIIHDNLSRDISLTEISANVGISPSHFARLFKQSTGVAPHQYVLELRVERAKALLSETTLPLAEIAYLLGFADQSHFTAVFRRLTRATPKAYRKAL